MERSAGKYKKAKGTWAKPASNMNIAIQIWQCKFRHFILQGKSRWCSIKWFWHRGTICGSCNADHQDVKILHNYFHVFYVGLSSTVWKKFQNLYSFHPEFSARIAAYTLYILTCDTFNSYRVDDLVCLVSYFMPNTLFMYCLDASTAFHWISYEKQLKTC